jgi:4-amino-4-deoxy-L-arabinose transferase-like glycosyltransferase
MVNASASFRDITYSLKSVRSRLMSRIQQILEDPCRFRRNMVIVLGIAVFMRLAVVVAFWNSWGWHRGVIPDSWNKLAINLADSGTFGFAPGQSTITRGPIFPLIEVPLYLAFGEKYAGWCLSLLLLDTLTCFLVITLFRKLWGNLPALLAGFFYAVNLPIIYYTAKISQVTSILPFVAIYVYLFSSWEYAFSCWWLPWVLGLVSGLMILNKTVYLPIPIACSALLVWSKRRELKRGLPLLPVILYLVVTAAVVAPWTVRNYVLTGGKLVPVQSLFWELNVQDVLYYDLTKERGLDRSEGMTLDYFIKQERQMLISNGVSPDYPQSIHRAKWEYACERTYRAVYLKWLRQDPVKILHVIVENLWNFWVRAENWQKTKLLILMQIPFLGAVIASLVILLHRRQLHRVKFGLVIVLVLWAEHSLVFAWGRFSLDLVSILGLIFGLGAAATTIRQPTNEPPATLQLEKVLNQ